MVSLNYRGFGALPLFDILVFPDNSKSTNDSASLSYLLFLAPKQVRFFTFSTSILDKSKEEIVDAFKQQSVFPESYLNDVDVAKVFSRDNLLNLVLKVCDLRQLSFPDSLKVAALEVHLAFLVVKLGSSYIHTTDFDSMVREAVDRLEEITTGAISKSTELRLTPLS